MLRRASVELKYYRLNAGLFKHSYRLNSNDSNDSTGKIHEISSSNTDNSWISSLSSKLSLEIQQKDSSLEAIGKQYSDEYQQWFIERWLSTPINAVQDGLEIIHFGLGIPWWATIGLTAIAVRLSCFPLLMLNAKQVYGLFDTQPIFKLIQDEYKRKKKDNEFESRMDEKRWFQSLYNRTSDITGYRIWKIFAYPMGLICSLPPFIFGARAIARRTNHDLNEGGLLWFTDLTKPDLYTVLPFVAVTMTWCVFSYAAGRWLDGRYTGIYHKYVSFFYFTLSAFPLMMIAVFVEAPCGIFCYWIPFSIFGFFCKIFMRNKTIQRKLNIAPMHIAPTEPSNIELNKFYHQLLRKYKRIHAKPQIKSVKSLKQVPTITAKQLTNPQNSVLSLVDKYKKQKSNKTKNLKAKKNNL